MKVKSEGWTFSALIQCIMTAEQFFSPKVSHWKNFILTLKYLTSKTWVANCASKLWEDTCKNNIPSIWFEDWSSDVEELVQTHPRNTTTTCLIEDPRIARSSRIYILFQTLLEPIFLFQNRKNFQGMVRPCVTNSDSYQKAVKLEILLFASYLENS